MESFLKQILDKEFKNCNYTIYNKLNDDGILREMQSNFGKHFWVDDFEYIFIDFEDNEKVGIRYRNPNIMNPLGRLEAFINITVQDDYTKPKAFFIIDKDNSFAYVVKLKDFDLIYKIKNKSTKKKVD